MIAKTIPRGERGRTAADEDGIRVAVEEEEEAEVEEAGAEEEKGRAGPPLHPASPPALSFKPRQLNEAI